MDIEFKAFDIKADPPLADQPGMIQAVVSVFGNQDHAQDVMVKGAFANSIANAKKRGKFPPGVWSHEWDRPIAKTIDAFESDEGLNIVAQFNLETQDGRDAYSNIKNGLFTEYSFGFERVSEDEKNGVTYVKDVNWYEWSPVLVGCNPETRTVSVKRYMAGDLPNKRAFETFLRDSGLSRKEAVEMIAMLFKGLQREADEATVPVPQDCGTQEPQVPDEPPITEPEQEAKTEGEPTEAPPLAVTPVVEKADSRQAAALYANFLTIQARLLGTNATGKRA